MKKEEPHTNMVNKQEIAKKLLFINDQNIIIAPTDE